MSKNTSGLGRGLGDLLEDNSPSVRVSGTVVRHDSTGDVTVSPEAVESREILHTLSTDYREPQVHTEITPITAGRSSYSAPLSLEDIYGETEKEEKSDSSSVIAKKTATENENIPTEPLVIIANGSRKEETVTEAPRKSLKALFREYGK